MAVALELKVGEPLLVERDELALETDRPAAMTWSPCAGLGA